MDALHLHVSTLIKSNNRKVYDGRFIEFLISEYFANGCLTPDRKSGICIKIRACYPLINMLNKEKPRPSQSTIDFLRQSHCGFEGNDPVVCCPILDMNKVRIISFLDLIFFLIELYFLEDNSCKGKRRQRGKRTP